MVHKNLFKNLSSGSLEAFSGLSNLPNGQENVSSGLK